MRDLMCQNSGQLRFMIQVLDQPGMHEYETTRRGKRIERRFKQHTCPELVGLRRQGPYYAVDNILNIIPDFRILHQRHGRTNQGIKLTPHLHLILQGKFPEQGGPGGYGANQQGSRTHQTANKLRDVPEVQSFLLFRLYPIPDQREYRALPPPWMQWPPVRHPHGKNPSVRGLPHARQADALPSPYPVPCARP